MKLSISFMFLLLVLYPPICIGMETEFKAAHQLSSTEYLFKKFNISQFSQDDNELYKLSLANGKNFLDEQFNLISHLMKKENNYLLPNNNESIKDLSYLILTQVCRTRRNNIELAGFFHGIFSQLLKKRLVTGIATLDQETINCINKFKEDYKACLDEINLFETFLKSLVVQSKPTARKLAIGTRGSVYFDEKPELSISPRSSVNFEQLNYEAGLTAVDMFCDKRLLEKPGAFIYEKINVDGKVLQAILVSSQCSQEFLDALLSKFVSINAKKTNQSPAEYAKGAAHRLIARLVILGRLTIYGDRHMGVYSGISESFESSLDESSRNAPKIKDAIDVFKREYLAKIQLDDELIANYHHALSRSNSPDRRANTQ